MDGNDIRHAGLEILVETLQEVSIKVLCIKRCNIDSAVSLKNCLLPRLSSLDLGGNRLTCIPGLDNSTSLQHLYLDRNSLE